MSFEQLWHAAARHNADLDNPFVSPSDETVKAINDNWDLVKDRENYG